MEEKKMVVLVEPSAHKELPHLVPFDAFVAKGGASLSSQVDFIISLGGDGTILHVNSLFPTSVPPIISFALGSLGFLTPFGILFHSIIIIQTHLPLFHFFFFF